MTRLLLYTATLILGLAGALWAGPRPVVVELYTSQGCSACPAADALLAELAPRGDVIALALHVDYWDYIGWADLFAVPAHADRQRAYAKAQGRRMIYTPEMIVQGQSDIMGAKPEQLAAAIAKHRAAPQRVTLELHRENGALRINAQGDPGLEGTFDVHLLRYSPARSVRIERGENAGRLLKYTNVVEGWRHLAGWDGQAPLELTAQLAGDKPVVVLIQRHPAGAIVAAARLR
ncbi:DUF1223 domain-containing protein [Sulfitobacter aestuarii]|uniref:DUF1223 domain-containing protein n=1 Tax=Sulfitobacter aestuarii TaxID=2161676 RepID=A0ABW5TZV9_9RHOB